MMAQCPVCITEYLEGQVKYCSTCGWDLSPYPVTFSGQIPEAFLEKERAKLAWARYLWGQWQRQIKDFNQDKLSLQSQLNTIKQQLQKIQQEKAQLQSQISHFSLEVESLNQQLIIRVNKITELQAELEKNQTIQNQEFKMPIESNNPSINATTYGLWGTFEAVLDRDYNSFRNPFESDLWILLIEISHLSADKAYNTLRIEGKYNLYTSIFASFPTSAVKVGYINNQLRAEANGNHSGAYFGNYVFWRKDEDLRIESKAGNFIRITGQLIRCDYRS